MQDQFYLCFKRNILFETDVPEAWVPLYYSYPEGKSRESSRISVNLCPIRAAFSIYNMLLLIIVNSAQIRGDSG